jgi:hypothetical protein
MTSHVSTAPYSAVELQKFLYLVKEIEGNLQGAYPWLSSHERNQIKSIQFHQVRRVPYVRVRFPPYYFLRLTSYLDRLMRVFC